MGLIAYLAYKKYSQRQVLKLVPSLLLQGAQIVDVRSVAEYRIGNNKGSINMPLDTLTSRINELDSTKPILICCASGSRSSIAKRTFIAKGFTNVHNVGSWKSLKDL